MKALSLRQPWAWLVVYGGKGIENRRWDTRFRGAFLIHASKGMTRIEYAEAVRFARAVDPTVVVPPADMLARGGIVGQAHLERTIAPCLTARETLPPMTSPGYCRCGHPWHIGEQFGFVLSRVLPLPFRPLVGTLGFFEVQP